MTTATTAPQTTSSAVRRLVREYTATECSSEIQKPSLYWGSHVSTRHIAPSIIANADSLRTLGVAPTNYWFDEERESDWDDLNVLVARASMTIQYMPALTDYAFHVGGDGATNRHVQPMFSTRWIAPNGVPGAPWSREVYLRLSQARTARHDSGVLRSPIDCEGVALELTDAPNSTDPRHAVTLFVLEPEKDIDPRYPWVSAHDARIYDMRDFTGQPHFVGPLYNGFPNRVTNEELLSLIQQALRGIITQLVQG